MSSIHPLQAKAIEELVDDAHRMFAQGCFPEPSWISAMVDFLMSAIVHKNEALVSAIHEALSQLDAKLADPSTPTNLAYFRLVLVTLGEVADRGFNMQPKPFPFPRDSSPAKVLLVVGAEPGISAERLAEKLYLTVELARAAAVDLFYCGYALPTYLGRHNAWQLTSMGAAAYIQLKNN